MQKTVLDENSERIFNLVMNPSPVTFIPVNTIAGIPIFYGHIAKAAVVMVLLILTGFNEILAIYQAGNYLEMAVLSLMLASLFFGIYGLFLLREIFKYR